MTMENLFCCAQVSLMLEAGSLSILHTQLSAYFVTGLWQTSPGVNAPEVDGIFNISVIRDDKPAGQPCVEHYYCPENDTRMFFCGFGFYNNETDGIHPQDCLPCPAGKYCFNGVFDCEPGYYCPGQGLGIQPQCGHYAPHSGMSLPLKCPAGTYQNMSSAWVLNWSGITMCSPCPECRFCDQPGLPEPVAFCHDGWYCGLNESSPRPVGQYCPPGEYCVQGKKSKCQAGYYQPKEAMSLCFVCPVGSYCSEAGLANVSGICDPGWSCDFQTIQPASCTPGHMCINGDMVECPYGTYQPQMNQSTCILCPVGKYCQAGRSAPTGNCYSGNCVDEGQWHTGSRPLDISDRQFTMSKSKHFRYRNTTKEKMWLYDKFQFKVKTNANVTIIAHKGDKRLYSITIDLDKQCTYNIGSEEYYLPNISACDINNTVYSEFWLKYHNSSLTQFGSGLIGENVIFNLHNVSSFTNIHFGSFSNISSMWRTPRAYKSDCQLGFYKQELGPCLPCPRGKYCSKNGMGNPTSCSLQYGYYCESGAITNMPLGKYCPRGYECTEHTPKPCGTFYNKGGEYVGLTQYYYNPNLFLTKLCSEPCPEYFNCSKPGTFHVTEICQPGYYCINGYMLPCEPGYFCYQGKKTQCPRGFTSMTGQDRCERCSNNTYCDHGIIYPCPEHVICENGLISMCMPGQECGIVNGSYINLPCQPGYHRPDDGNNDCVPCPDGYHVYHFNDGKAECLPCTPGFYCTSNVIIKCWVGHHCPGGNAVPIPCPSGYYQPNIQQTECLLCPVDHYCDAEKAAAEKISCPECPTYGVVQPYPCPFWIHCNETGTKNTDCEEDPYIKGSPRMSFHTWPYTIGGFFSAYYRVVKLFTRGASFSHENTTVTWSIRECESNSHVRNISMDSWQKWNGIGKASLISGRTVNGLSEIPCHSASHGNSILENCKNLQSKWDCNNNSTDADCRRCVGQFDTVPFTGSSFNYDRYNNTYNHRKWKRLGFFVKVKHGSDNKVGMAYQILRFLAVSPSFICRTDPTTGFANHTNFTRVCTGLQVKPPSVFDCKVYFDSIGHGPLSFTKKESCDDENFKLPVGNYKEDFKLGVRVKIEFKGLLLGGKSHYVQVKPQPVTTTELAEVATSIQAIASQNGTVSAESIMVLDNVASILNDAFVVGLTTNTEETTANGSSNSTELPTSNVSSNSTKRSVRTEQELKKKKTKIRDDIVEALSHINTSSSLDSISSAAQILNKVTNKKDEISSETKKKSIEMYSTYTNQLKKMKSDDPNEKKSTVSAARTLLYGMASMIDLVSDDYQGKISKKLMVTLQIGKTVHLLVKEFQPLISVGHSEPNLSSAPTTDSPADIELDEESKAATEEMKNTTKNLFQQVRDISSIALKNMGKDSDPEIVDTPFMSLSLEKQSPEKMKGKILTSDYSDPDSKTTMTLPDDLNISGVGSVSTTLMFFERNPFVWDEKSETIQPLVSLALQDETNTELKVSNLTTPINLDFKFGGSEISTTFPLLLTLSKSNGTIRQIATPGRPCAATFQFNVSINHLLSVELKLPQGIRFARLSIRTDKKLSFKDVIDKGFRFPEDHDMIEKLYSSTFSSYPLASDFNNPAYYCRKCALKCCSSLDKCTGLYTHCMYYCTYIIRASVVSHCIQSSRSLQHQNMLRYCHKCYNLPCEHLSNTSKIYLNCFFLCYQIMNVSKTLECKPNNHLVTDFHNINISDYCDICNNECCPPLSCSSLYRNCAYYCEVILEKNMTFSCQKQITESAEFTESSTLFCFQCYAECCLSPDDCNKDKFWNCAHRCSNILTVQITDTCKKAVEHMPATLDITTTEYCNRCYNTCCSDPITCENSYFNCLYYCRNESNDTLPIDCQNYSEVSTKETEDVSNTYCQICFDVCCTNMVDECEILLSNCVYFCIVVKKLNITSDCEKHIAGHSNDIEIANVSEFCQECEENCCRNDTNCFGIYTNCVYICVEYFSQSEEGCSIFTGITVPNSDMVDVFEPMFFYPLSSLFIGSQTSFVLYFGISLDLNDTRVVEDLILLDDGCLGNMSLEECSVDIGFEIPVGVNDVGCTYWDDKTESWSTEGLKLAPGSRKGVVKCTADHLTAFSKAVFVVPAYVDPLDVGSFITVFENPVVVTVVLMVWLIYFFLIHWARQSDKSDVEKVGVINCPDNLPSETYAYLVCVATGWWSQAGTTSNVYLCLQGSHGNSARKCLTNSFRKCFQTGYDDWFLITTEHSLGDLQSVTLWHDNTGKNPHWFVNQLYAKDLQRDGVWTFIYNDWLAVDRGSLLRTTTVIQAVTQDVINSRKKYNFLIQSINDLRNVHLWISIFSKSPSSTFTRVQRLTCALSLLLTTMLTNIMFYGIPSDNPEDQVNAGEFQLSLSQIVIGIVSSLIMFPVNILIVQLFLKTKSRQQKDRQQNSRCKITLCHANQSSSKESEVSCGKTQIQDKQTTLTKSPQSSSTSRSHNYLNQKSNENHSLQNFVRKFSSTSKSNEKPHVVTMVNYSGKKSIHIKLHSDIYREFKSMLTNTAYIEKYFNGCDAAVHEEILSRKAQQFAAESGPKSEQTSDGKPFPWWFIYIAWTVAMLTCIISSYFVMLYGLNCGYTRSVELLVSFITGLFQSIFIQQPLKVIGIAVIWILILKKTVNFEESLLVAEKDEDEDYLKSIHVDKPEPHLSVAKPLPVKWMKQMRERLQIKLLMDEILWDMVLHCLYVLVVFVAVYGQSNIDEAYDNNVAVRQLFADPTYGLPITEVSTKDDFFEYLKTSLVPGMTILTSEHQEAVVGSDHYLVGTYRLRQLRVKPRECELIYIGLQTDCKDSIYLMSDEDDRNFQGSWSTPLPDNLSVNSGHWVWQSTWTLQSWPYAGDYGYYSGGGYVLEMPFDTTVHQDVFNDLKSSNWIDSHTRAVILEFTLYNPNVDLFTIAMYMFEFTVTGKISTMHHEFTGNLYQFSSGFTPLVVVCQIAVILFNVRFVYLEVKKLKKVGAKEYFCDFWSYFEIVHICLAITALGFFIKRLLSLDSVMAAYKDSMGLKFVSFYPIIFWHFAFTYVTAGLVSLVTAKTVKMLKFNKHLHMVSMTISHVKGSLINFVFIFCTVSISFASLANLFFGRHNQHFQSFYSAWGTNIRILLGEFDFVGLHEAFRALGPVYVVVLTFTVGYGLLYIMMTVLNVGQIETVHKLRIIKNRIQLFDYVMSKFNLLFDIR